MCTSAPLGGAERGSRGHGSRSRREPVRAIRPERAGVPAGRDPESSVLPMSGGIVPTGGHGKTGEKKFPCKVSRLGHAGASVRRHVVEC